MGESPVASARVDPRGDTLQSARAVRERCEVVYAEGLAGRIAHWRIDEGALPSVVDRVVEVTSAAFSDVRAIPYHSRWRHFGVGGVDRVAHLDGRLAAADEEERLAARVDLAVTSVLLDAGAGEGWAYRDVRGGTFARSEGLAVASYDLFAAGGFSADSAVPLRADASALLRLDAGRLASGFQVDAHNPLVGLDGRAALLRRLGERAQGAPSYFGHPEHGERAQDPLSTVEAASRCSSTEYRCSPAWVTARGRLRSLVRPH